MSAPEAATLRTYRTGREVSLLWPRSAAIAIEDIACALSRQCRFVGHVAWPYSVAQHSVLASFLVPRSAALWALLHDASEAYLGDVSLPLKATPVMARYRALEALWERTIFDRFGLHGPVPACVAAADAELLRVEQKVLQFATGPAEAVRLGVVPWTAPEAEERFLARFHAVK